MKNRVGLGTFPLADVFSHVSKDDAKNIVRQFIQKSGYYIDTAPMYGFGEVEVLLGEVFKEFPRDKYYVVTKCGYIDVEGKTFQTIQKSGKYDDVIRECDISLKRMGLDYIDLYFMHSPDPNTPPDETVKAMVELKKQGKIKEIGVSNVNLKELKEYNKNGDVKFIQNRFSLINQSIDIEFQNYLVEHNIKLVPYQVIDRGQLSDRVFNKIEDMRKEDLRIGRSDWLPEKLNVITDWVKEELSPIAKELNISLEQLSIAWALHQKYLGFVIVGMTKPEIIPVDLESNNIQFDNETLLELDKVFKNLKDKIKKVSGQSIREFRGLNEKYY